MEAGFFFTTAFTALTLDAAAFLVFLTVDFAFCWTDAAVLAATDLTLLTAGFPFSSHTRLASETRSLGPAKVTEEDPLSLMVRPILSLSDPGKPRCVSTISLTFFWCEARSERLMSPSKLSDKVIIL